MKQQPQLLIFDAMNLVRRVYAVHSDTSDALQTTAHQTTQIISKCLRQSTATHAVAVFDGLQPSWRKQLFPLYKANRKPLPDELANGLEQIQTQWLSLGVDSVIPDDDEADDVIATLATKAANAQVKVTIVSTDQGYYQILSPNIAQWDPFKKQWLDIIYYQNKFSVMQHDWAHYRALTGESGSNIPGISGIGPKTAITYLEKGIDGLKDKPRKALQAAEKRLEFYRKLVRLRTDRELEFNLNMLRVRQ